MRTQRIYLATSWKNPHYPGLLKILRAEFEVYDFRDPEFMFKWFEVNPAKDPSPEVYRDLLYNHPEVLRGANRDFEAMEWCDTIVAVEPFGKSGSFELGWCQGKGKKTILHFPPGVKAEPPELMFARTDFITADILELHGALEK